AGAVPRELLERDERGTAAGRTLVLEAAAQQLQLLPEAELADASIRSRALAVVGTARGRLELVLPLAPEIRELALGPALRQRVGHLVAIRAELLGSSLEQRRARVVAAVDAVPEAHQPLATVEEVLDVLRGVAELLRSFEHRQDPCRRAAVERARERADGR